MIFLKLFLPNFMQKIPEYFLKKKKKRSFYCSDKILHYFPYFFYRLVSLLHPPFFLFTQNSFSWASFFFSIFQILRRLSFTPSLSQFIFSIFYFFVITPLFFFLFFLSFPICFSFISYWQLNARLVSSKQFYFWWNYSYWQRFWIALSLYVYKKFKNW